MHEAKVIEVRQVSDGALAILARCCNDEMTDSWHTCYDTENIEQHLSEHPKRVAAKHAKIASQLDIVTALGHSVTRGGHVIPGECPHCGRGTQGTSSESR